MSKATKILWGLVLLYFGVCCLLAFFKIGVLDLIMAENATLVIIGAVILQVIISTINGFMEGYKGEDEKNLNNDIVKLKYETSNLQTKNDHSLTKAVYNHSKDIANSTKSAIYQYKDKHKTSKEEISNDIDEDSIYEQVMIEIEDDNKVKSTWAKALAQSEGNKDKTISLYIKYRTENIMSELRKIHAEKKDKVQKEDTSESKQYVMRYFEQGYFNNLFKNELKNKNYQVESYNRLTKKIDASKYERYSTFVDYEKCLFFIIDKKGKIVDTFKYEIENSSIKKVKIPKDFMSLSDEEIDFESLTESEKKEYQIAKELKEIMNQQFVKDNNSSEKIKEFEEEDYDTRKRIKEIEDALYEAGYKSK